MTVVVAGGVLANDIASTCVPKLRFSDRIIDMANGEEDLREKNKEKASISERYDEWRVFQGKEDAEMLQEKSSKWKSKKEWSEKYDRDYDD